MTITRVCKASVRQLQDEHNPYPQSECKTAFRSWMINQFLCKQEKYNYVEPHMRIMYYYFQQYFSYHDGQFY